MVLTFFIQLIILKNVEVLLERNFHFHNRHLLTEQVSHENY